MRHGLFLAMALVATPLAAAKPVLPDPPCPALVKPSLFIAPTGEAFRPKGDDDVPARRWFDQADANHDGRLTIGELMLDGDRFFATLDKDHDGELWPEEVHAYEYDLPEMKLYQAPRDPGPVPDGKQPRGPKPKKPAKLKPGESGYDTALGAGRYAYLNIPNPVASADSDINRAVSANEFRAAMAERFRDLDTAQAKALTFADLPKTPAQVAANAACLARLKEQKDKRR